MSAITIPRRPQRRGGRRIAVRVPRKVAEDVTLLHRRFGEPNVLVNLNPARHWAQIGRFRLVSSRWEFNMPWTHVLFFWPTSYGELRGSGAGVEEFYTDRRLRFRSRGSRGAWELIPNTHLHLDRRGGDVVTKEYLYACVHLNDFDPRFDNINASLDALRLFLTDPTAFNC